MDTKEYFNSLIEQTARAIRPSDPFSEERMAHEDEELKNAFEGEEVDYNE